MSIVRKEVNYVNFARLPMIQYGITLQRKDNLDMQGYFNEHTRTVMHHINPGELDLIYAIKDELLEEYKIITKAFGFERDSSGKARSRFRWRVYAFQMDEDDMEYLAGILGTSKATIQKKYVVDLVKARVLIRVAPQCYIMDPAFCYTGSVQDKKLTQFMWDKCYNVDDEDHREVIGLLTECLFKPRNFANNHRTNGPYHPTQYYFRCDELVVEDLDRFEPNITQSEYMLDEEWEEDDGQ